MIVLQQILDAFHRTFQGSTATLLIGGAREPLYIPRSTIFPYHRIFFVGDSISSALHEVAHWCIAGKERRRFVDYGYWYSSEERDLQEQNRFMSLEVRPQALEAIFHEDLEIKFNVSLDSFHPSVLEFRQEFSKKVSNLKSSLRQDGLAGRALQFSYALRSLSKAK